MEDYRHNDSDQNGGSAGPSPDQAQEAAPPSAGDFHQRSSGFSMSADDSAPANSAPADNAPSDAEPVSERANLVSAAYPSFDEPPAGPAPSWGTPAAAVMHHPEPPAPTPSPTSLTAPADDRPVPVVKVLSVRGVEYAMMSILLWFGAGSLIYLLVSLINGNSSFDGLAFPLSLLIVCLPGFAFFFLRLRKAELDNPSLRLEPSKRRYSQITQILAFLTCFFNIVTVVFSLLALVGGEDGDSVGKILGSAVVILLIAGGILFYYWQDEHKLVR